MKQKIKLLRFYECILLKKFHVYLKASDLKKLKIKRLKVNIYFRFQLVNHQKAFNRLLLFQKIRNSIFFKQNF